MFASLTLLFVLTNMARVNVAPPLMENVFLDQRAQVRADHLCSLNQWSHRDWEDSFALMSYWYHGENLARGTSNEASVEKALLASPTHRSNILDPHFTKVGFGYSEKCQLTVELFAGEERSLVTI